MKPRLRRHIVALAATLCSAPALAAAMTNRPFSVGGGEGGGPATGLTGWILNEQAQLTHLMSASVKALHDDPQAIWGLAALGFVYGVFHAAGPGHGKALIASYMMANDRALRRGVLMAFFAAALQSLVAIALVGAAALIFNATSTQMNVAANWLELASYGAIAAIGAWLVLKKGAALLAALRALAATRQTLVQGALYAGAPWARAGGVKSASPFLAFNPDGAIDPDCGHVHAPDPRALGDGFSLRAAAATVLAAGARPCSGAILILVFSLAQGLFPAGVAATLAMGLGTALTTGALASLAVFAKSLAMRFAGAESSSALLLARGLEFAAALFVLGIGLALLYGGSIGG